MATGGHAAAVPRSGPRHEKRSVSRTVSRAAPAVPVIKSGLRSVSSTASEFASPNKNLSGSHMLTIFVVTVGVLFLYSGIQDVGLSAEVRAFLQGKKLPTKGKTVETSSSSGGTVTPSGGTVSSNNAANKSLGQKLAGTFGWNKGEQWTALNNVIMRESGWSSTAANPTSNARGIGQNINGWSKDYQENNPAQQIHWTLNYIKQRYGTPTNAWQHEQQYGWY